jgi:hypothetical protein
LFIDLPAPCILKINHGHRAFIACLKAACAGNPRSRKWRPTGGTRVAPEARTIVACTWQQSLDPDDIICALSLLRGACAWVPLWH